MEICIFRFQAQYCVESSVSAMANDREVLKLIWEGKIPISFHADPSEVIGLQPPEPIYFMISRISYLPLVTDKVTQHFSRFIANEQQDKEIWFESAGKPLKWNYPVGILYDLHSHRAEEGTSTLPWTITVHFGNSPDSLLKCPNKEIVESQFMSALKEADFLKHRGQIISAMQKKDHTQLWLGLTNGTSLLGILL